jgi:hypothetical protein
VIEVASRMRDFISCIFIVPVLIAIDCYQRRPKNFRPPAVGTRRRR